MEAPDFDSFYRGVYGDGKQPFPWQRRLAERVMEEGWPDAIAVPTGCGKTTVIDVAVYALAAQAHRCALDRTTALRIFFVIDRRLVVDDVSRHAENLARQIQNESALAWARDALGRFRAPVPLATAVLRGGMYRSSVWADQPNQPLVCVSTVDQVGSRLLFRGYGLTDLRRPVDAALVGNDSLLIVDEAHLSKPFLDTLASVRRYQEERELTVAPGLRHVQMSATLGSNGPAFGLEAEDYQCEKLTMRLQASKPAVLKECPEISRAAADEAQRMEGVVGIVVNTVGAARAIHGLLKDKHPAILLTGRVRPWDRDQLIAKYLPQMKAGRNRSGSARLFVVATQTIEVGADLDFDGLVTEAAPIDSLRQRFGRLNRLGEAASAAAVVLKPKGRDPVYGEPLENTWKWLKTIAGEGIVDFGVENLMRALKENPAEGLTAQAQDGPLVFSAHLDAWAQTNPSPAADPDVAAFLHGPSALESADVQVVWRADLENADPEDWAAILTAAPPVSTEGLPLSIGAAKRWLKQATAVEADLEGIALPEQEEGKAAGLRVGLIWRGPKKSKPSLNELRPGDTIVVRSSEGGCDEFGWNPDCTTPVRDIGDECANQRAAAGGGRLRLRIHPAVLCPGDPERQRDLAAKLALAEEEGDTEALKEIAEELYPKVGWSKPRPYCEGGVLVLSRKIPEALPKDVDEGEEDAELSLTEKQSLRRHTKGVVEKVGWFAEGCGIEGAHAAALKVAAELHDVGKCDKHFQYILNPAWTKELAWAAKGDECSRGEYSRRLRDSGYPAGSRHEFISVALAESTRGWEGDADRELALYLIGTHHGHGRAMAPVWIGGDYEVRAWIGESEAVVMACASAARLGSGWTDRYWALTRKYGWWGLAYLEAILRRADCVRSREEQQ